MAVNPTQQQVTDHFTAMAKGNVLDEDMSPIGKNIAGRKTHRVNYRMRGKQVSAPVTNVTSSIATVVDQAGAMVQKGGSSGHSVSRKRKRRSDNTAKAKPKKRKTKKKKKKRKKKVKTLTLPILKPKKKCKGKKKKC